MKGCYQVADTQINTVGGVEEILLAEERREISGNPAVRYHCWHSLLTHTATSELNNTEPLQDKALRFYTL